MYTVRVVLLVSVFFSFLSVATSSAQDISLLPTGLTFSNQVVGLSSGVQEITLTNTDEVHALTITTIVASGDFTQSNTCGSSVAAGKTCTISVQFAPASVGAIDGSISVFDNAPGSPQLVGLSGTGLAQETVSPSSLNFGTVTIGKTSTIKAIKLTNNTASSIAISSITASGDFSAVPATSGGCGSSLGANASCTEDVFFTPTELGTVDGSVIFADASSQQYVALTAKGSGTADSPITLTPSTLAFGNQTIDSTSVAQSGVIKNTGATSLSLTFAASGSYIKSNPASGACSGSLAGGSSCTIDVQFSPAVLGAIDGGVSVSYSGANSPQVVGLTGTGVGQVTISPTSIAFPPQQVDTMSGVHKVTVTNNSSSAISVNSIVSSTDFKETNTCGGSIAVGLNCIVSVSFTPTQGGLLSGSLIITDSATNSPQIVDLSGSSYLVPRFAYVANEGDGTVSMYTVNSKTGQLRSNSYIMAGATLVAVDPTSRFAYVVNATLDTISAYTINASTGTLTPVASSTLPTGTFPQSITVDPTGKFVYVANNTSGNVSAYTINGDTGALTAVTGSPFGAASGANSVVVCPSGQFAYVADQGASSENISAYTINPTTGALTAVPGSPYTYPSTDGGRPTSAAADPAGNFLYVTSNNDANVAAFSINAATGALTLVPGSPYPVTNDAASLTVAPSGKFVYVVSGSGTSDDNLSVFKINTTTGALTLVDSAFSAGLNPSSVTLDSEGNILYVTNLGDFGTPEPNSNEVWTYSLNSSTGVPTLLSKSRTRLEPTSLALGGGTAAVTYTPKFAYTANDGSNSVSAFTINASNGHLTAVSGSPFTAGSSPSSIATDPFGKFAYVANTGSTNVSEYTINSGTGALTPITGSPVGTPGFPYLVTVDPSDRFAYVGNGADISAYTINTTTGALTLISGSTLSTVEAPTGAVVDPTGQFLYVTSAPDDGNSGYLCVFTINPSTGALSAVTGSPFTTGVYSPTSVAMDPSSLFAYVANYKTQDDIYSTSSFEIDSTTGIPTLLSLSPNLGAPTAGISTDPLGQFIYSTQPNPTNDLVALSFSYTTFRFTILNSDVCIPQNDPVSSTVDPSGKFVYVANAGSTANNITACAIDLTTGDLSNISGQSAVPTGMTPVSITTTGTIH
jgi:6-phosphogluconolactonase (cycloisomerase 2 family)